VLILDYRGYQARLGAVTNQQIPLEKKLAGGLTNQLYYGNIQVVSSNKVEIKVFADDLMTVPKAAKALGHPKMTLYRWIEIGKVHAIKLGGILFVPVSEIERLKEERE